MAAGFNVVINKKAVNKLLEAQVTALEMTAEAIHTEVIQAQVMPRDTGALQNEMTYVDTSKSGEGTVSLVSSTPYARRLYYHPEYDYQKHENPNAGGHWYKEWLSGGKSEKFAQEAYKQSYKQLTEV